MRPILLTLLAAAMGCASAPALRRPVHGEFNKTAYDAIWQRAVEALRAEGFEIGLADAGRGFVVTTEREASAPCGEQRCLTREMAIVKLERDGRASLVLNRKLWNAGSGDFRPVVDAPGLAHLEKTEQALLQVITGKEPDIRFSRPGESCGDDTECAPGLACRQGRCAR